MSDTAARLEVRQFARLLAGEIGATVVPPTDEMDARDVCHLHLANGVRLTIRGNSYQLKPGQVAIYAGPVNQKALSYSDAPRAKWPEIKISTTRKLPELGRDVIARAVTPALPLVDEFNKAVDQKNKASRDLDAAIALLAERCPALEVRRDRHQPDARDAAFYHNKDGVYVSGRVSPYGVTLDRIGSISPERFALVMEALTREI